ncbi:hypothetical protein BV22DRAFT_618020 [Leucogyrophana mollusca]|uniref:Uncharacterized protein n=1 Tax=Leucogyrophana mollusca TaxID=85980 RepID=A0ACB8BCI3_9AGAM|nr:hypothetical protein BV22DRAFT_618020 [Leucogyrophana mollusca]
MFGFISTYLVNLFYVWRISTICGVNEIQRHTLTFSSQGVLATARVGAELGFCVMSIIYSDWSLFADVLMPPFLSALVLSAAVDCVIAISMTYFLRQGRTSFAQTRSIVNRLVRYVMGSGLLTFLFTTAIMISLLVPEHSVEAELIFFALVPVQSK